MTTLALSPADTASVEADALVVGVIATPTGPRLLDAGLPAALRELLGGALDDLGVSGTADEVVRVPTAGTVPARVVVLTGVGRPDPGDGGDVAAEAVRRAVGAAVRSLAGTGSAAIALPADGVALLTAVIEGAALGAYSFRRYRSALPSSHPAPATGTPGDLLARPPVSAVTVLTPLAGTAEGEAAAERSRVLAEAVNAVRDLVNTSPSELYPASFAERAVAAVADLPVTATVLDEAGLVEGGYGGLLGVGMGSARTPRLVHLDYAPEGATTHLALVGKGITFDSGGLSIKPAQGMDAMKSDMAGAAAVLHAVVSAARLGLRLRVSGWLALAENMPSGTAQRPSDVLTIRGGRTVEVLNTDAEGRLVLADAIVAAGEREPDVLVDVATLTGAQMVALGNRTSAIMSNDDDLRGRIHRISTTCGEQFWPMPLPPELRSSMDSAVADIANMGDRYGGMLVAGLFLQEFVGSRPAGRDGETDRPLPWAHLDIAGPAFNTGQAFGYTPAGGTGVAVRTLLGLAEELAGE
ncbi:MAG: leucyl aminopeptidase [Actinomycetales bacterium]|nr:leucyl aminopeptidase [Actinomycetales bacterium]